MHVIFSEENGERLPFTSSKLCLRIRYNLCSFTTTALPTDKLHMMMMMMMMMMTTMITMKTTTTTTILNIRICELNLFCLMTFGATYAALVWNSFLEHVDQLKR
jgi:hypothetical protein